MESKGRDFGSSPYFFNFFFMVWRKTRIVAALAVAGSLAFVSIGNVSASGGKYSTLSAITEGPKVSVQYGEGIVNTLKNSSTECPDKAFNSGNGGEVFYFSKCGFWNVSAPAFEADSELLNLWQAGQEDVRADITNKAKYGVYSALFQAMKNSYEVDTPGTSHTDGYAWQDSEIERMKKNIPDSYLLSHSGAYDVDALDFLWRTPEIAPQRYYTDEQKTEYQKFEKKALALVWKLGTIKDTKTKEKLRKALEKSLKNAKAKMGNDAYLLQMIALRAVSE